MSQTSPANLDELLPAFKAVREVCRRNARSFYFASSFLPREKRDAAYAIYAFCRMIDDAIDEDDHSIEAGAQNLRHRPLVVNRQATQASMPAEAETAVTEHQHGSSCGCSKLEERLNLFRGRLDEIYENRLELPHVEARSEAQHSLCAFGATVRKHQIPKQYFLDLAEGCRMDLSVSRYATWASLEKYCYHVAGVVGLMMCGVFGVQNSEAGSLAIKMGNAMQLTNILRDIKEDADKGRIYLPLEDLARFKYSQSDLQAGVVNDSFVSLMKFEIARARKLFQEGSAGLCWLADDGSRLTASTMAAVYSGILDAIERQKYDIFTSRAHLSTMQKIRRLPLAWRMARRKPEQPMPQFFRVPATSR